MGNENRKINRANPAVQGKILGSGVVVVDEITGKKKRGDRECRNHALSMGFNPPPPDHQISGSQQSRANRV